jgi:hypothetical protein
MAHKKHEPAKFIEILSAQSSKTGRDACGDVISYERSPEATTAILCDGLGSGIKANLAATMCASRLTELLRLDFSLRHACERVVATMHKARTGDIPFSAFSIVRIRIDGFATILTYEMPPPLLIENGVSYCLKPHFLTLGNEVVSEFSLMLKPADSIMLTSDGISQAGLGGGQYKMGWTMDGASLYVNSLLNSGILLNDIPGELLKQARLISGGIFGDDTSVLALSCRQASLLNILTGLPDNAVKDDEVIKNFYKLNGKKAVCGSTTAEVVGRVLRKPVKAFQLSQAYYQPPQYAIDGFDLVSEGAITLNQAYNILDADWGGCDLHSCVADLCRLMKESDCINFWVGTATNLGHQDLVFKQMNIMPRVKIVERLADKLKGMGKLVTVQYV